MIVKWAMISLGVNQRNGFCPSFDYDARTAINRESNKDKPPAQGYECWEISTLAMPTTICRPPNHHAEWAKTEAEATLKIGKRWEKAEHVIPATQLAHAGAKRMHPLDLTDLTSFSRSPAASHGNRRERDTDIDPNVYEDADHQRAAENAFTSSDQKFEEVKAVNPKTSESAHKEGSTLDDAKNSENAFTSDDQNSGDVEAVNLKISESAINIKNFENALTVNDQNCEDVEAVNPKISGSAYADRSLEGTKGEADTVYDPVSLAHMRLNRKEVHSDCNLSNPGAINPTNSENAFTVKEDVEATNPRNSECAYASDAEKSENVFHIKDQNSEDHDATRENDQRYGKPWVSTDVPSFTTSKSDQRMGKPCSTIALDRGTYSGYNFYNSWMPTEAQSTTTWKTGQLWEKAEYVIFTKTGNPEEHAWERKRVKTIAIDDPVSLAHMRLNRKVVDSNCSHPQPSPEPKEEKRHSMLWTNNHRLCAEDTLNLTITLPTIILENDQLHGKPGASTDVPPFTTSKND